MVTGNVRAHSAPWGIWNFAHVDLHVPEGIQVESVHLSDSLMKLSYNLSSVEAGQE